MVQEDRPASDKSTTNDSHFFNGANTLNLNENYSSSMMTKEPSLPSSTSASIEKFMMNSTSHESFWRDTHRETERKAIVLRRGN